MDVLAGLSDPSLSKIHPVLIQLMGLVIIFLGTLVSFFIIKIFQKIEEGSQTLHALRLEITSHVIRDDEKHSSVERAIEQMADTAGAISTRLQIVEKEVAILGSENSRKKRYSENSTSI